MTRRQVIIFPVRNSVGQVQNIFRKTDVNICEINQSSPLAINLNEFFYHFCKILPNFSEIRKHFLPAEKDAANNYLMYRTTVKDCTIIARCPSLGILALEIVQ